MIEVKNNLSNWAICEFKDLLEYLQPTNYIVESTEYDDNYDIPVLTAGKSFIKGYTNEKHGIFEDIPVIIFDDFTTSSRYVNFPFKVKSSAMKILVPSCQLVNLKFFYFYMKAHQIRSDTHKRYWISVYAKKQLLIPPLNEQHRILNKIEELFSNLDKGIESLKIAREKLKVYRQALLKHAFEGKLTEQWRKGKTDILETTDQLLVRIQQKRENAFVKQLKMWESAVAEWSSKGEIGKKPSKPRGLPIVNLENEGVKNSDLPESWHCLMLVDLVLSLNQGWSPKCNNIPADDSEWGVIKTTAIQNLNYQENENKQLPEGLYPRPWLEIKPDDILITRAGPRNRVGVVCRVKKSMGKLMLCDKAYRMRFPRSEISPAYVEALLNSSDFIRKIETLKTGISDSGLNITQPKLLGLYLPVPPLNEQHEIVRILAERLSIIEKNISDVDDSLEKCEALRQSILKKAFSGQLVPQDTTDEPASKLLKRIAIEKAEIVAQAKAAKAAAKKVNTNKKKQVKRNAS